MRAEVRAGVPAEARAEARAEVRAGARAEVRAEARVSDCYPFCLREWDEPVSYAPDVRDSQIRLR